MTMPLWLPIIESLVILVVVFVVAHRRERQP
jgi:hypothetical protein